MKIRFVISLFLLFSLTLAACSCAAAPTMAPAYTQSPVEIERPAEVPAAQPLPGATAAPAAGSRPENSELALPNPSAGRMIIKDALMDLLVADAELAIERVTQLAADQGGYLVSSRLAGERLQERRAKDGGAFGSFRGHAEPAA